MTRILFEGQKNVTLDDAIRMLRHDDELVVHRLADLARTRKTLRKHVKRVHDRGACIFEASSRRRSNKPKELAEMIFDATDTLAQNRHRHNPVKAREFGSRGGRPRKDREISDKDAEGHWFDMRHATNDDALKHMGKWTENAAWRRWGASGRKTGPRAKLPAKPKRKSR